MMERILGVIFLGGLILQSCGKGDGTGGSSGVGGVIPEKPSSNILYSAITTLHGRELWFFDAETATANRLTDINPGTASSNPSALTIGSDGKYYFAADDGTRGRELWMYDPSTSSTSLLRDIQVGLAGSDPRDIHFLNGKLYFSADDTGSGRDLFSYEISSNTLTKIVLNTLTASEPSEIELYESKLYLSALTESNGREPIVYTPLGSTFKIFNFGNDSVSITDSNPSEFKFLGNYVYFAVNFGDIGREIGKINTVDLLVPEVGADVSPGSGNSDPSELTVLGTRLYFVASHPSTGEEIYVYDPDAGGGEVSLTGELYGGTQGGSLKNLTALGNSLYFISENPSIYGNLYALNGGEGPIELVTEVLSNNQVTKPGEIVAGNKNLIYVHDVDNALAGDFFSGEIRSYTPGAMSFVEVVDTSPGPPRGEVEILKVVSN